MTRKSRKHARAARNPFDPLDGPIAATLDLHGFSASEATDAVATFLDTARSRSPGQIVHIITGKGRGSPGRPVLLPRVRTLLRSGDLTAVADWGPDPGGGGFLVRLRR